jgi:thiol-disulfide isomerase/thioredoxin
VKLSRLIVSTGFFALALALPAQPAADLAEQELQALEAVMKTSPVQAGMSRSETILAFSRKGDAVAEAAMKFIDRHPVDPRRWTALQFTYQNGRSFITAVDAEKLASHALGGVTVDEAAKRAWDAALDRRVGELIDASDVPEAVWQTVLAQRFFKRIGRPAKELPAALPAARADLDLLEKRFPDSAQLRSCYSRWLNALDYVDEARRAAEITRLLTHANAAVAQLAQGLASVERLKREPMELKFTAVDGREVDLAKLRGKVVLVDFWATWCGPCIDELPNIKKVYNDYHARGFEIVGIALDRTADRQKLIDLCAKESMPWPQHFDGNYWKNEVAVAYSINAIPAMFLLDQEGRLVTTRARGDRLEAEVKRLLKL